ncbi:mechanosensitive ion channel family protein [Crocosphaera sp.]|uniref:mechanosensitive ion channel family protein n=1 Tax=Crocosphaera sp. TaxID=2729996 RepID=UPI003F22DA5A|nr:mechanosensitive ion channel family protein [Crocosphaera sp.]
MMTKKYWQALFTFALVVILILIFSPLASSQGEIMGESNVKETTKISIAQARSEIQEKPEATPKSSEETSIQQDAPVVLDGKTLFTIKVGGMKTSAQERAEIVTEEIQRIAKDSSISLDSFALEDFKEVIIITAQDNIILGLTNDDASAANQPLDEMANQYLGVIKNAIIEYRKERTHENLGTDILLSVVWTIVMVILIFLLFKLESKTQNRIEALRRIIRPLRIGRLELFSLENEIKLIYSLFRFIRLIILLALLYTYFSFIFRIFPETRDFGVKFRRPFYDSLNWVATGFINFLPNLFIIILTIVITHYLIRFCGLFFRAIDTEIISFPGFDSDWAKPTNKIVVFLIIAGALAVVFPYLPMYNSPAFRGISVLIGALITFGGASTVANLVGGTVIIYTRAYRLGDLIKTENHFGFVHEKTILSTRIRTLTGEIVTIPNANLMSTSIINYNAIQRELKLPLMIHTRITLGYDVPWRKVYQTLSDAANATENILEDPAPYVLQTSLDDFYITYELRAYINLLEKRTLTLSKLHENIQDKCNEVGIEIMSPHYSAIRDGNQNTIPEDYLPEDYNIPGFRVHPRS